MSNLFLSLFKNFFSFFFHPHFYFIYVSPMVDAFEFVCCLMPMITVRVYSSIPLFFCVCWCTNSLYIHIVNNIFNISVPDPVHNNKFQSLQTMNVGWFFIICRFDAIVFMYMRACPCSRSQRSSAWHELPFMLWILSHAHPPGEQNTTTTTTKTLPFIWCGGWILVLVPLYSIEIRSQYVISYILYGALLVEKVSVYQLVLGHRIRRSVCSYYSVQRLHCYSHVSKLWVRSYRCSPGTYTL